MDKPRIRPVEAFPIEQQEQTYICLRDPTGLAPEPILLRMGAYFIITLFDGRNEARDIQGAFVKRFGENLPAAVGDREVEIVERRQGRGPVGDELKGPLQLLLNFDDIRYRHWSSLERRFELGSPC